MQTVLGWPPSILLWRGSVCRAGLGMAGAHIGSSDHVLGLAWACSRLSEALPVPGSACPVQTFAFPVYPDPQCKTTSPKPRALLALSPRPPWEDASGLFSKPVGIEMGAGPSSLSSMNWPGGDRTRCFQGTVLNLLSSSRQGRAWLSALREAQRTGWGMERKCGGLLVIPAPDWEKESPDSKEPWAESRGSI